MHNKTRYCMCIMKLNSLRVMHEADISSLSGFDNECVYMQCTCSRLPSEYHWSCLNILCSVLWYPCAIDQSRYNCCFLRLSDPSSSQRTKERPVPALRRLIVKVEYFQQSSPVDFIKQLLQFPHTLSGGPGRVIATAERGIIVSVLEWGDISTSSFRTFSSLSPVLLAHFIVAPLCIESPHFSLFILDINGLEQYI